MDCANACTRLGVAPITLACEGSNLEELMQMSGTTHSAESPTAWASFATGVNPGKHNIYDFLIRDTGKYVIEDMVIDGLHEGEAVVTSANFLIDAESNLNAALKGFAEAGSAPSETSAGEHP